MRMAKRIISIAAALAVAFSLIVIAPLNSGAAKDYTDAYGLLNALGVYKGESNPTASVTRRELAVYIQRITNAQGSGAQFYDVSENDADAAAICAVAQSGYMTGNNGFFYPERALTSDEAIATLLRVAGYEEAAKRSGGYPTGYLKWAVNTKLLKDVGTASGNLTHGDLSQMLYNLMNVNMFVIENYTSNGELTQAISQSNTVLNEYFDCIKWQGRVVATPDASIWNRAVCGEGKVVINNGKQDYLYMSGDVQFDSKLGIVADFYTRYGEEEIVYCEYNYAQYEIERFMGDDIQKADRAISFIEYTDENDKLQKVNTSNASFVYNGRNHSGISPSEMQDDYSVIECCDVDSDNSIDVVYVWSYDVIMVDTINFSNYKITDKISGKIIDFNPDECETVVRMDGGDYDLSDISEYYTLLVAESYGDVRDRKITIEVFPDSIEGKLTAKSDEKSISVNGETYKVRDAFDIDGLKLNEEYIFGIDFDGNALCVLEKNFWPQKYGFALNIAPKGSLNKDIQIRLFTENNQIEVLTFAKKFKLNGNSAQWSDLAASALFDGDFKAQLVSYKLNSEGLVSQINVSDGTEVTPSENGEDTLTLNKRISKDDTSIYYRLYENAGQFGDYISADSITRNFYIMKSDNEFLEEEFKVGTPAQMGIQKGYFDIDIYDASYERVAGAAVYYLTQDILTDGEAEIYSFVVEKTHHRTDEDGNYVIELIGLNQGQESKICETEQIKFTSVRPGDVLMTWSDGEKIIAYKTMFSLDETTLGNEYFGYDTDSDEFDPENRDNPLKSRTTGYYGEILSVSKADKNIYLTKTRSGTVRPVKVADFTNYYVYDSAEKTLEIGNKGDLDRSCKNVYFVNTYGVPRDVIIFK